MIFPESRRPLFPDHASKRGRDRFSFWSIGALTSWRSTVPNLFVCSLALAMVSMSGAVVAREAAALRTNRVEIEYVAPKNPAHEAIYQLMRERKVLERFREYLSPLRLPRVLRLKIEGCDGEENAWYADDAVTVCYEYLDSILKNAPEQTSAGGVTHMDAVIGPLVDVFLHEVGHAVFDYGQVPILGREEDAADQFAAYFWLQSDKRDARRLLAGVAYEYTRDAAAPTTKKNPFADAHGLPMQRFYNLLCLAYGSDTKLFEQAVTEGHLPADRADGCEDEYAQVKRAMTALIDPFIDENLAKRVRSKQWFNLDETIELK
jgi:Putative metallopeptidase